MSKIKKNSHDVALGKVLRAERKAQNKSLEEVASAVGISYQQIQKYESGANRITVQTLLKISNFLDVPIYRFFRLSNLSNKNDDDISYFYDPDTKELLEIWKNIKDDSTKKDVLQLIKNIEKLNKKSA